MTDPVKRWGLLWRCSAESWIMWHAGEPLLFFTRPEARAWAEKHHGYIRTREDLRRPPHSWRMPRAVRVNVRIEVA